ncbi:MULTISPECIES: class I SAM-dependent methyltransferase [Streptosporangium]|uniref:SAM-dependent methyltransferase n=1 Tax=Streptosporangium brasiliense TaxID=47480 RepID=A0ABT9RGK4_9ACTN|nr:class I SAM-dependent methyltransferase [Streptosporangium brasiliense]MDP9867981.1 SAM-dependent methyltransferase [Streptosporangium brasiliense]
MRDPMDMSDPMCDPMDMSDPMCDPMKTNDRMSGRMDMSDPMEMNDRMSDRMDMSDRTGDPMDMDPAGEAERFWEKHYAGRDRVWNGNPNPLLAETARTLRAGTALDLGSGEGGDAVHLAAQGWQVTAVDVSATALARARAHARAAGVADRVTTQQHDLARTFPHGAFDLISAQYLHSPLDLPREHVLRQAARALAPGGLLLIVDHGSVRPWAWDPDPHTHFPTPQDIYGGLHLDPARYRPERLDTPRREAVGPNGETATVTDTVVAVRRVPHPSGGA